MKTSETKIATMDEYIEKFPENIRLLLEKMRATIRLAAPNATEKISYQMPAFFENGVLVYFAGYKNHIGFYPTSGGIAAFKDEITMYKNSKGAVQFPIDKPLPINLIKKIVKFRVTENSRKTKIKKDK